MKSSIKIISLMALIFSVNVALAKRPIQPEPEPEPEPVMNVITVEVDGSGDFFDPITALESITDSGPTKSYLIKIGAGTYDLSTPLWMRPFVDVEGAGIDVTNLTGTLSDGDLGLVAGANNTEIRDLTILFSGSTGIMNRGLDDTMKITRVKLTNSGIQNIFSSTVMTDVQVTVSGGRTAIICTGENHSCTLIRVSAIATGISSRGLDLVQNNAYVEDSILSAQHYALVINTTQQYARIYNTTITGPVIDNAHNITNCRDTNVTC